MFDSGLLKRIEENPEKGMSELIEQFSPLVYTVVKNKLSPVCSREDIEETVADVFISFYNRRESVDLTRGSLSAYLTTLAKRRAADKLRAVKAPREISTDDGGFIEIPNSFSLETAAERNLLYARLIDEIKALGELDSTIVFRKYYLGESAAAIAQYTGLTDCNVRQRLSRALKKIEEKLKGDYYEDELIKRL